MIFSWFFSLKMNRTSSGWRCCIQSMSPTYSSIVMNGFNTCFEPIFLRFSWLSTVFHTTIGQDLPTCSQNFLNMSPHFPNIFPTFRNNFPNISHHFSSFHAKFSQHFATFWDWLMLSTQRCQTERFRHDWAALGGRRSAWVRPWSLWGNLLVIKRCKLGNPLEMGFQEGIHRTK